MSQDTTAHEPPATPEPSTPDGGVASTPSSQAAAWKPSYVFLAVVTLVNLVADVVTKQWIKHHFEQNVLDRASRKIEVIPNYVNLIFATNKGGAWGILQGETESLRRPFFLIVSVAAIVFILSLYRKLTPGQRALKWGLPLVLGGALGNLIDRILYGWVIDFIDCYTKVGADEKHWPTFNVADIAICVGVGLMAIDMFTTREEPAAPASTGPTAPEASVAEAGKTASPVGPAPLTVAAPDAPVELAAQEGVTTTSGDA
jgi:signal peptidase II